MQNPSNNETGDEFKKKRELYSQNIRRNNREQLLNKRRNIDFYQETDNINNEHTKNVFDEQYAEQIKKLNEQTYQLEFFDQYLVYLGSHDVLLKYKGLIAIRSVIDSDNPKSIQRFMGVNGLLQTIINYAAQSQNQQMRYQSMHILSTTTYGDSSIAQRLVDCGLIQVSIQIIASNLESLLDFALISLGNISAQQAKFRDKILNSHGLQYIYKIINCTHSMNTYENSIWVITNLCRGTPPPQYELVDSAIPILCNALKKQSFKELNNENRNKVVSDVLWTLSNFTSNGKSRSDRLIEQGIIPQLFHYAYAFGYSGIYFPATQIIGNLASQGEKQTQAVIDNGVFDFVLVLLSHEKRSLRREGCWIISNLAAGTINQTNSLLRRKDIFDKLSKLIESGDDRIVRQIIWIYPNLGFSADRNELLKLYLGQNIIEKYINLIQINKEAQYLIDILKTLTKILLIGNKALVNNSNILLQQFINVNGPQKVSNLQQHKSESVYDAVIAFLNKFFDIE